MTHEQLDYPLGIMPVFADLDNPRVLNGTPEQLATLCNQVKSDGFDLFTPKGVCNRMFRSFMGDSEYEIRMGIVKTILAQAIFAPEEFQKFSTDTAKRLWGESLWIQQYGLSKSEEPFEVRGDNPARTKRNMAWGYAKLAGIIDSIKEVYPNSSSENILRATELNHYFSGKHNGTGIDITFTYSGVRELGAQTQQVVELIWNAHDKDMDPNNPLRENEMFPVPEKRTKTQAIDSKTYLPFQPDLDQKYPINKLKLHPDDKSRAIEGEIPAFAWVSTFRNSPANNSEAEIIIGKILTEALRAGQWIDLETPQDQQLEGNTFELRGVRLTIPQLTLEYRRGAQILVDKGLAQLIKDEHARTYLRPTQALLEFIKERIGFSNI